MTRLLDLFDIDSLTSRSISHYAACYSSMNLIFDTNVILDIFLFENCDSSHLWETVIDGKNISYYSEETLSELKVVLSRPIFDLNHVKQQEIIQLFLAHSTIVETLEKSPCRCKDPEDQKFIDLAFSLAPSKLISRDKRILKCSKKLRKHSVEISCPPRLL